MRVLHMLPTFETGGLGSLALELVRAWPEGHQHSVMASRFPPTHPVLLRAFEELAPGRVREIPRTMLYPISFVETLHKMTVDDGPFDGAVIYNWFDAVWYCMGLNRAKLRNVVCHVGTVIPQNDMTRKMVTGPNTAMLRYVPASESVRDSLIVAGADPARVLPARWNGVDLRRFPVKWPEAADASSQVTFGFTGRMAPNAKDFERLIRAYARLEGPAAENARLVLAGEGTERRLYEELARSLGLTTDPTTLAPRNVRFLGNIASHEVPVFLQSLDVFVMAALPIEGMSMALVEAIATALPIIATDVPSNREVLTGAGCGYLVKDTEAMAQAMEWLATDWEARARLAAMSRQARDRFGVSEVAAHYARLLKGEGHGP